MAADQFAPADLDTFFARLQHAAARLVLGKRRAYHIATLFAQETIKAMARDLAETGDAAADRTWMAVDRYSDRVLRTSSEPSIRHPRHPPGCEWPF
jgi:hypothetical protein